MRIRSIARVVVASTTILLVSSISQSADRYYFEPETIGVHLAGGEFTWHLMMETDVELCAYRFDVLAPLEGVTLCDPDTLWGDWTGTGADSGGFQARSFEYDPVLDRFTGEAARASCPPGLQPGTCIAVRIIGDPGTPSYGLYTFAQDPQGSTSFTDQAGDTFPVPLATGYMNIAGTIHFEYFECPSNPVLEETTVVIALEGYCHHKGALYVECDAGMPEWAHWDTTINMGVEGTLTLTPTFTTGPWSGDFTFRYQCSSSLQNIHTMCHIEVVDNLGPFLRADANADSTIEMADAIFTLKYLYVPGAETPPCMDAADSDDAGSVEMSDAIYTLKYLYVPGSPPPPPPGPASCGLDPTADDLNCGNHPCFTNYVGVKTVKALH